VQSPGFHVVGQPRGLLLESTFLSLLHRTSLLGWVLKTQEEPAGQHQEGTWCPRDVNRDEQTGLRKNTDLPVKLHTWRQGKVIA